MRRFFKPKGGTVWFEDRRPLPWFTPEFYEVLRDIVMDAKLMPFSYDTWKESAEHHHRDLQRRGLSPVRVVVNPDAFVSWCAGQGVETDGEALSRYCWSRAFGQPQKIPRGNIKDR